MTDVSPSRPVTKTVPIELPTEMDITPSVVMAKLRGSLAAEITRIHKEVYDYLNSEQARVYVDGEFLVWSIKLVTEWPSELARIALVEHYTSMGYIDVFVHESTIRLKLKRSQL